VPELGKPGSVGALGVQSPRATQRHPILSAPCSSWYCDYCEQAVPEYPSVARPIYARSGL
jgi:hypothetical protein